MKNKLTSIWAIFAFILSVEISAAQDSVPAYKNPNLPVDQRVQDLLGRMSLEEKVRQLDMYSGSSDLLTDDQLRDHHTHAKTDAVFNPVSAEKILGNFGVGSIHDTYPPPQL